MATAETKNKERVINQENKPKIKKEKSMVFLITEYERMVEYQKVTNEGYHRWFNVYLAVVTAIFVLIGPLSQSNTYTNLSMLLNFILGGLVFLGAVNFIGLSYANSMSIQYERAMRLIQDAFMEDDPIIRNYLYFRVNQIGVGGSGFRGLIIRGFTGGSQKSLLVLINSLLLATLTTKIAIEAGMISREISLALVFGCVVFLVSASLHLVIARLVYQVHGI